MRLLTVALVAPAISAIALKRSHGDEKQYIDDFFNRLTHEPDSVREE